MNELVEQGIFNIQNLKPGDLVFVANTPGYTQGIWRTRGIISKGNNIMPVVLCTKAYELSSGDTLSSRVIKEYPAINVTKIESAHLNVLIDEHLRSINKLKGIMAEL